MRALLIFILTLVLSTAAHAATVTLQWNENPEPNIAGYRLYAGVASRQYAGSRYIAGRSNTTYTYGNLLSGTTYFFAATAIDDLGVEGGFSEEVAWNSSGPVVTPTPAATVSPTPTATATVAPGINPVPDAVVFYARPNATPPQTVTITTSNGQPWVSHDSSTWFDAQPYNSPAPSGSALTIRMTRVPSLGSSDIITLTCPGLPNKPVVVSYQAPPVSPTPTAFPSATPQSTPTATPTPGLTATATPPPPTPTPEPTSSPSPTPEPTETPTPTPTPTPEPTPVQFTISGRITSCSNNAPLAGLVVRLDEDTTTTDAEGRYSFTVQQGNTVHVFPVALAPLPPASSGIDSVDVIGISRAYLDLGMPTCSVAADVTDNGIITTVDAIAVQRFFLGMSGTATTGTRFFYPIGRIYESIESDQADQDYTLVTMGDVQ